MGSTVCIRLFRNGPNIIQHLHKIYTFLCCSTDHIWTYRPFNVYGCLGILVLQCHLGHDWTSVRCFYRPDIEKNYPHLCLPHPQASISANVGALWQSTLLRHCWEELFHHSEHQVFIYSSLSYFGLSSKAQMDHQVHTLGEFNNLLKCKCKNNDCLDLNATLIYVYAIWSWSQETFSTI